MGDRESFIGASVYVLKGVKKCYVLKRLPTCFNCECSYVCKLSISDKQENLTRISVLLAR